MAIVKKVIGRIPQNFGEWYPKEGGWSKKNRVNLFGSEFESLVDGNIAPPAVLNESTQEIVVDENWRIISDATEAYLAGDKLSRFGEIESEEFVEVETDNTGKIISSRGKDGVKSEYVGFKTTHLHVGEAEIEHENDPESRTEMTLDLTNRVVSYRDKNGVLHENAGITTPEVKSDEVNSNRVLTNSLQLSETGMTEFKQALINSGFQPGGNGDWSYYLSKDGDNPLHLPEPRCAILNILSDIDLTTLRKGMDAEVQVEFYDMAGNYFKKWVFLNGQGNSSMMFPKKNMALDFFDEEAGGDAFSVRFGDWVPQDSFHLKGYYTDFFKGLAACAYNFYDAIVNTRGVANNRTYKRYFTDFFNEDGSANGNANEPSDIHRNCETGAYCHPNGFPVIVYQNGTFYGIFSWQIKKHRDNYNLIKDNPNHLHLDGEISSQTCWTEDIDWDVIAGKKSTWPSGWTDGIEFRNPKNLVYAEAHDGTYKYDADSPGQYEIAGNRDGSMTYDSWVEGSYAVNKIVEHNGHYFLNTIADNTNEPIFDKKKNSDSSPDFKNKTGCGWLNVTNTVKVKTNFITFSKYCLELKALEDGGATATEMRAAIAERFDVDAMIDYIVFNNVISNTDGWGKNWQWTTWDGVKWSVNPYDLDILCGSMWLGTVTYAADGTKLGKSRSRRPDGTMTDAPSVYVWDYYTDEIHDRFDELKSAGIITLNYFINLVENWMNRVGYDNYVKEYEKWDEAPCNRRNGTYQLTPTDGGHFDSIYRLNNWFKKRLAFIDAWTWQ